MTISIEKFNYLNHLLIIDYNNVLNYNTKILNILLTDKTTNKNIIWATDDYEYLGEGYGEKEEIHILNKSINQTEMIKPRLQKVRKIKSTRRKDKGEVFTPSWMCNKQNNLIDNAWFGEKNVFNTEIGKTWKIKENKINFPKDKKWEQYVRDNRLEIACGEAPYLVSRYDTVTGEEIHIKERIGLLDRKLRIISENVENEKDWLKWTEIAFKSIYGFEFQGDSLLLARFNLLNTFIEYMYEDLNRLPTNSELENIAEIISWNLWQMDGETYTIPFQTRTEDYTQLNMFDNDYNNTTLYYCKIKNWDTSQSILFKELVEGV